jgi:hypothetical protein
VKTHLGLALTLLAVAGCYSPSLPNGKQQCGTNGACPSGYQCGPDNHCYKSGQIPAGDMSATPPDMAMACTAMSCKGGPKPVCDTSTGACVECLMDVDCPSGKLCNNKACVPGCTATHGCPDGGGMCNTGNKMCMVCMKDADCSGNTPRCDTNSGNCVECLPTNDNCSMGKFCGQVNGVYTCQTGCQTAADCPKPDAGGAIDCCNHICVDTDSDGKNCGKCSNDCGNESCCTGKCSDLTMDLNNCGLCGNACAGKNATWGCSISMCKIMSCSQGFGDCNGSASDGCEATLATDPNNCGMCNMKCTVTNGVGSCANNTCGIGMCNAGFGNCDNNLMNGCETSTTGDVNNCGMCGTKCSYTNGVGACVASMCALAMCNNGFANCDNNLMNGCEAATASDPNNCGGCNMKCQAPNANTTCSASKCVITSCANGFKDCDMAEVDGCEIQTATDPNNCGNCGMKCAGANVMTNGCANSACTVVACNPGFANCNGVPGDGCEINTNTDKNNCGTCGHACGNCVNGACGCNNTVLVIPDDNVAGGQSLVTLLNQNGLVATLGPDSITYAGAPAASNFSAVIILVGNQYATDMPVAGQTSILNAAGGTTGVVFYEWAANHITSNQWQTLKPLLILSRTGAMQVASTYTLTMNHPVWTGLPNSFTFLSGVTANNTGPLANGGVQVATCTQNNSPAVAVRDGASRIVEDGSAPDWNGDTAWQTDPNRKQLVINYAKWATHCM